MYKLFVYILYNLVPRPPGQSHRIALPNCAASAQLSTAGRQHNEKMCRVANPSHQTGGSSRQVSANNQTVRQIPGRTSGIPARKFASTVSSISYLQGTSE